MVKTIRDSNYIKSRGKASLEVNNMRDLRHPHVAALLGTFFYLDRLSILIFPAACCDLHQYMKSLSNELAELRQEKIHSAEMLSLSDDGTHTPDSTSSSARNRHIMINAAATLSKEALANSTNLYDYNWPLKLPYLKKLEALRGYFVCLAQALNYIHSSDVRHKDIKPENILIDSSGSVIITDFGISRSFPKQAPRKLNFQAPVNQACPQPWWKASSIKRSQDVMMLSGVSCFHLLIMYLSRAFSPVYQTNGESSSPGKDPYATGISMPFLNQEVALTPSSTRCHQRQMGMDQKIRVARDYEREEGTEG